MRKKFLAIGIIVYSFSTIFLFTIMVKNQVSCDNVTTMCLSANFPSANIEKISVNDKTSLTNENKTIKTEKNTKVKNVATRKKKKATGKPRVLIYHTHATESYLPSYSGNYHTTNELNTVRDAGNVLEDVLEENDIGVIHDKTIHDNPSYDGSYQRSFDTIVPILKKYPSIECIIDLHRDATAANVDGPVENIDGKSCAVYSYVLSNGTDTYGANKEFLSKLNSIARSDFHGFTGEILERPYSYNQELGGKAILIELGNNRNTITQVRNSANVFGQMLAKALKN